MDLTVANDVEDGRWSPLADSDLQKGGGLNFLAQSEIYMRTIFFISLKKSIFF